MVDVRKRKKNIEDNERDMTCMVGLPGLVQELQRFWWLEDH
jgi:hypothetical protein